VIAEETMAVTVAGTFDDRAAAQLAIERLRAAGIPAADISLIVQEREAPTASEDAAAGVRGGAAVSSRVDPSRPDVEPEQVEEDEVEVVTSEDYSATATGTATGGLIGAIGGLLVGLGTLALPGMGPIVAAGPLAAALGGAAIGAATGGLIGALVDAGVPEEFATTYATHVERGRALVTVRTDAASAPQVRDILAHAGALHLHPATVTLV
jgi:uncharacterized membrane protein